MSVNFNLTRRNFGRLSFLGIASFLAARKLHALSSNVSVNQPISTYHLPSWFDSHRVNLHTRLASREQFLGQRVGEDFASLGIRIYTRHVKTNQDGPYWPTKIGSPHSLATDRNFVSEMVLDAHNSGCKIIGYYWIPSELSVEEAHPDWLCRSFNGKTLPASRRGNYLCLNSPYREFVKARLIELVKMGLDGIYFDYRHRPSSGCWCKWCQSDFKSQTGLDLSSISNIKSPLWPNIVEFGNATIESSFRQWRTEIHARNPDCVMCVSSSSYANLHTTHMSTKLFPWLDSNKTEFRVPYARDSAFILRYPDLRFPERDVKLALGWSLCRDGSDGRPAHVWLPMMKDETRCMLGAAGIITHGCIANIDIEEAKIPDPTLKKAIELCENLSPVIQKSQVLRWAAVHFSELGRRKYIGEREADRQMWVNSTSRTFGAYRVFLREHLPVGIVTDQQLEQGVPADCKILFLPNPELLTPPMQKIVALFQDQGGLVIEHSPQWNWSTEQGFKQATQEFRNKIASRLMQSPTQVLGGHDRMHTSTLISEKGNRWTIPICNDFSQIYDDKNLEGEWVIEGSAVAKCENVVVKLNTQRYPMKLYEAVTKQILASTPTADGIEVKLPTFSILSVLVAEF